MGDLEAVRGTGRRHPGPPSCPGRRPPGYAPLRSATYLTADRLLDCRSTCTFALCLEGEFSLCRFPTSWRGARRRFFDPGARPGCQWPRWGRRARSLGEAVAGPAHEDLATGADEPVEQGFGDGGVGDSSYQSASARSPGEGRAGPTSTGYSEGCTTRARPPPRRTGSAVAPSGRHWGSAGLPARDGRPGLYRAVTLLYRLDSSQVP